jgi:hypothetical protein
MDPLDRADAALARARARGAFVVTPEDAVSPMDAANTLQIPRTVVAEIDREQGDLGDTMVVPQSPLQSQPTQQQPHPKARRAHQQPQPAGRPQQGPHQPPAPQQSAPPQRPPAPGPDSPPQRPQVEVEQWHQEPQQHQQGQVTEQFEQPAPALRQEEGMVPTVKRPPTDNRPSLAQRLDGQRRSLG